MPQLLEFDARGRFTLPKYLRDGLGKTVIAIKTPHGVTLHPVPIHVKMSGKARDVSGEDAAESEV